MQNGARIYEPKKYPLRTHKEVIDDGMEAFPILNLASTLLSVLLPMAASKGKSSHVCRAHSLACCMKRIYVHGKQQNTY